MYKIKNYNSKNHNIKTLREYRDYFGYVYPIESHHLNWYNRDIKSIVNSLNRECNYLCMPWDTACKELIGLAVHKMLLSKNKKCQETGIDFAKKYMYFYHANHKENNKNTYRLLEDISYIADTLEKYREESNESFLQ